MMKNKSVCLAVTALVAAWGAEAHAQGAGASAGVDNAGEKATATGIEEVVVTAQKRGENIQNVPITVQAATAADLASLHIEKTADLSLIAPGLKPVATLNFASPYLRGIGSQDVSPSNESPVGTYVDGVYFPQMSSLFFALAGVERIEVLQGPQGTLFGRNATGGAIQVITKDPSQKFSGSVRVGYANYRTPSVSTYVNLPISEKLAVNFSGYFSDQGEGWGRNLVLGNEVNKERNLALRSKVLFTPGPDTKVTLAVDYVKRTSDIGISRALYRDGLIPAVPGTVISGSIYDSQNSLNLPASATQYGTSLKVQQDVGGPQLISLTSFRWSEYESWADLDSAPADVAHITAHGEDHDLTQEFQLVSEAGRRLTWIVGAFYMDRYSAYAPFRVGGTRFAGAPFFGGTTSYANSNTRSLAGYAQATLALDEARRTNLTTGIRYTSDRYTKVGNSTGNTGIVLTNAATAKGGSVITGDKTTYRVALDHHFTDNVMAYVSWNTGYKGGFFNVPSLNDPPVGPETITAYETGVKADFLNRRMRVNLSAFHYDYNGVQLTLINGATGTATTVNAASAKVEGVDLTVIGKPTDDLQLQLNTEWLPTAKYVSFPTGVATIPCTTYSPSFPGDPAQATVCPTPRGAAQVNRNLSGYRMIFSPKWAITASATYTIGQFQFNAAYKYQSDMFTAADNRTTTAAYGIVDLNAGWTSNDDLWELRAFVDNVGDETYVARTQETNLADSVLAGAPRTYGFTVQRNF